MIYVKEVQQSRICCGPGFHEPQAVTLKVNEMEQILLFRSAHTQQRRWTCNGAKAAFCCHSRNGPKDMKKRQAGVTPS